MTEQQEKSDTELQVIRADDDDDLEPQALVYEDDEVDEVGEPRSEQYEPDDPEADVRSRIGSPEANLELELTRDREATYEATS